MGDYTCLSPQGEFSCNEFGKQLSGLCEKYFFLKQQSFGKSVSGVPLTALFLGNGRRRVLISAAHHGNEWLTSLVVLRFIDELCGAAEQGDNFFGADAYALLKDCRFCFVPLVNPDGAELASAGLSCGKAYEKAKKIAAAYPDIPFPRGWKANMRGVDLNLQYPTRWKTARKIKYSAGYTSPAPKNFVGRRPLSQPESRALYSLTLLFSPHRLLALHTQGKEIYWQQCGLAPAGSLELGKRMAAAGGYTLAQTPSFCDNAGYKDWFIHHFGRSGFTLELGLGESPLPLGQLNEIYMQCAPMLLEAAKP